MTTYESASGGARGTSGVGAVDRSRLSRTFTETKNGFKTSEFFLAVIAIAGILIAAFLEGGDSLSRDDGFRYASWVAAAYIISRGLAKLGTREPYTSDDT
jgi:hypothetical protein